MDEKFKIILMIKKLIESYDKLEFNSKHELKLKDDVLKEGYYILKITYIANDSYNIERKQEIQIEILSRIKFLEYLTSKLNISDKEYQKYLYDLNVLSKYIQNWIKYSKKAGVKSSVPRTL